MNERLSKILGNPWTVPTTIGVVAFGSGLGLGYILGLKRRPEVLVEEIEIDTQLTMDFYGEEARPALEDIQESMDTMKEKRLTEEPQEEPAKEVPEVHVELIEEKLDQPEILYPGVHNTFSASDDDWDYEEELAKRTPDKPYVLHKDEFWHDELGFTQVTLTYYRGDDILADEDESPIYNHQNVVGSMKFGHGSGDPNVVYIRNESRRCEYEVLLDEGLYSQEVLNLDIEDNQRVKGLQHSHVRKFRTD